MFFDSNIGSLSIWSLEWCINKRVEDAIVPINDETNRNFEKLGMENILEYCS